jgi:oligopeptide transport system substrate-binding protein
MVLTGCMVQMKGQGRMNTLQGRRTLVVWLLAALLLPILAACGGAPGATSSPAASPVAETSAEPSVAAPESAAPSEPAASEEAAPSPDASEATSGADGDNILRIHEPVWPDSLNPQTSSFSNEIAILSQNYEGLTKADAELNTIPGAAESWEYNDDATVITFTLREDLTYSDGSPLTSEEFANAARRTLDPTAPGDYQTIIGMIEGAEEVIATEIPTESDQLEERLSDLGIETPDERTIVFRLTQPTPYFHVLGSLWVFYPAKQELVEAGGETWFEDPANQIGNGPFQFTTIDQGQNLIEYEANENYYEGRPQIDGIQIRVIEDLAVALQAYRNDEVDIITPDPNDVPSIRADPELSQEYQEYPGSCTIGMEFNFTQPPFDEQLVREAFAYGFDREGYTRDALQGTAVPTLTWIPPGYPGYDENESRFAYDPDQAKAKLSEAGYENGQGLPEIRFSYNSSNPANQGRAEYIVQMYRNSLGVEVQLDPVEATTLTNLRKSPDTHPQMNTGGWCADYPDPQNWLSVYWNSSQNFAKNTGYVNTEVDRLTNEADVETDPERRAELYQQAQEIVVGDVGHVMLYNNLNTYLVKPYVQGIEYTPQDSSFAGQEVGYANVTLNR